VSVSSQSAELAEALAADPTALVVSFRARFVRRLTADPVTIAAAIYLAVLLVLAIAGGPIAASLTGHGPNQQFFNGLDQNGIPLPPFSHEILPSGQPNAHGTFFILGTDRLGRDMLVRILYGARATLIVGIGATAVALLVGLVLGMIAGYFGGRLDAVISRGIETAMAFPSMLFAIGLAAVLGAGLVNSIIVIALFSWYYPARIVRMAVLSLRGEQFVEAARSIGLGHVKIMRRHLLPLLTAPLIVYATGVIALNILFEAGLSYLGLGVRPPTADWGQMIADGVTSGLYREQIWTALIPGLALVFTTLAFNQLGDGLRDAFAVRGSIR
jgi:ABC-type dipeptide/oligopeptide/nickel transport system permease subunit